MKDTRVRDLTDKDFQETLDKESMAVADFWAEWCGPCRMMLPIFAEVAEEVKDIAFFKLNVDEHTESASKLNVYSLPTFMIFKNGKMIDTQVGAMSKSQLVAFIDKLRG